MTTTAPLAPADLATLLGTDPRTTRKFLRSITPLEEQPGKGSRWAIKGTKANIATLTKKFAAFNEAEAKAKADRAAKAEAKVTEAPAVDEVIHKVIEEVTHTDLTDDEGPTDADIEAIMAEGDDDIDA